jgi:hypothetical protein
MIIGYHDIVDFRHSYVITAGSRNSVRFVPESRCVIFDDPENDTFEYVQCAACRSEYTFSQKNLFTEHNYNFTPVFGRDHTAALFCEYAIHNERYFRSANADEAPLSVWGKPSFVVHAARTPEPLDTPRALIVAAKAGAYIVVRTEIANAERGLRALVEYPAKTINMNERSNVFQIDTGPIVFPDLWATQKGHLEALRLAFIAFNSFGRSEVLLQTSVNAVEYTNPPIYKQLAQKSPVVELFVVDHYCDGRRLDASHRAYALD